MTKSFFCVIQGESKKKPAIIIKGEITDRHNTFMYFKCNLCNRFF